MKFIFKRIAHVMLLFLGELVYMLMMLGITGLLISFAYLDRLSQTLPELNQLEEAQYQMPMQIFSRDGMLLAEYGVSKRTPVTFDDIPLPLLDAFIAAEDNRFYQHPGVDYIGLGRAAWLFAMTGRKSQGGSTITMQVARNFLLSRTKTFTRKFKEILLAFRLESRFSKPEILTLYLNKIYLGHHAYGVAAAAHVYYQKPLDQLTLAEAAMIAGLPKAPSIYNPLTNAKRAMARRDYILKRMFELGYIDQLQLTNALTEPNTAQLPPPTPSPAPYVAEMARQEAIELFGDEVYESGYRIYTTIDAHLQAAAQQALRDNLHDYDERHGWRAQANIGTDVIGATESATVLTLNTAQNSAEVQRQDGSTVTLPWRNCRWARPFINRNRVGRTPDSIQQILTPGQNIRIRQRQDQSWALAQRPEAEGALVALDAIDGAILALVGGYDYFHSKFNRATQALRQPGSGFKPIVYTTALEQGYSPATVVNDTPLSIAITGQSQPWRPENYSHKYYGPTTLRTALRLSRNIVAVKLLLKLGIPEIIATGKRFGFSADQLPASPSLALGSGQTTPLQMARMYTTFANGGYRVTPHLIERVEQHDGQLVYAAQPAIACDSCQEDAPAMPGFAPRILAPETHFLITSMLRDVVTRGTATHARRLGRHDLAGKTGTTNDQRDAWFNGFGATVAATAWIGFDDNQPLGRKETGGQAALPMWTNFMAVALAGRPEHALTVPSGVRRTLVDPTTGLPVIESDRPDPGVWEYLDTRIKPRIFEPPPPPINDLKAVIESLF
ncbi:MAG: PBP1A family penicillin-binding protein [Methylococcales bacterium]|nr:PBP1A family penicillin-binding protein [Methylococcales bacterium]